MATSSPLNESQQRRLLSSAKYADKLLSDVEAILNASESKTIFPRYRQDVSPSQAKLIRHSIARFRDQLARVMDGLGIVHEGPGFGSIHSIRVALGFIQIAIQEMAPHYLRGYGEVPENAVPQLQGLCAELEGLLERLDSSLAQGPLADLNARLERLGKADGGADALRLLDRIISDRGLVELRPRLSTIVERLESNRYEIAVFGRVSSGKSSLLNHVLQTTVLPVGVTPITAVPTRLIHGREPLLRVSFADRRTEERPIEHLPEFVSEVHNPANTKGVVRLVVELPSERLSNGLGFVDTPGLGSLATAGAAETLAYLPQCDLGVVLVSAGSPINDEDLSTIRALYESAIPVKILLSKADLLSASDLDSALEYTRRQARSQLAVEVSVHPVSTAPSHAQLLDDWFDKEIAPLYQRHQELAQESIRRKTGALREAVVTALRTRLNRAEGARVPRKDKLLGLERDLRDAAGRIERSRRFCLDAAGEIRVLAPRALEEAATALLAAWEGAAGVTAPGEGVAAAVARTAASAAGAVHNHLQELARLLAEALQRTADALGSDDAPGEEELALPLREMPRFDPPPIDLQLPRPWFPLPRTLARRRLGRRLRSVLGEPLSKAFATHARLVEDWSRKALAELQARFDSSADLYRAQLSRLIGQGALSADEQRAIQEDLARLGVVDAAPDDASRKAAVTVSASPPAGS
ncbi:MAG: dynamin family protein [Bryobacteraceae bacterium]